MIKSPIVRIGGKGRLAPKIAPLIADLGLENTTYIEPFCGSASVFFYLYSYYTKHLNTKYVLNDADDKLINVFEVIRKYPRELIHQLYYTPYSKKEFVRFV
jgi:DNA adenine methylase